MVFQLTNNLQVHFRLLTIEDSPKLFDYFQNLSQESKERFSPHGFDIETVQTICKHCDDRKNFRFVVEDTRNQQLIGYFIAKNEVSANDQNRFLSNGIVLIVQETCSFAPSIADEFQGVGLGKMLFDFMLKQLESAGKKRLILLGGVQQNNNKAIQYYKKLGFQEAGSFERNNTQNLNMWRAI